MNTNPYRKVLISITAAAAIVASLALLWQGGWMLAADGTDRQRDVMTNSNQYVTTQTAAVLEIAQAIADVDVDRAQAAADDALDPATRDDLSASLTAQRVALVTQGCEKVATMQVDDRNAAVTAFAAAEC